MTVRNILDTLYIRSEEGVVTGIGFADTPDQDFNEVEMTAFKQINEYLEGNRRIFTFPFRYYGTDFQMRVWTELCRIPYGCVCSYSEIAELIDDPYSYRAVANACNRNPLAIVVPCHRVIHRSGNVSGYAYGNGIKEFLLSLEAEKS